VASLTHALASVITVF